MNESDLKKEYRIIEVQHINADSHWRIQIKRKNWFGWEYHKCKKKKFNVNSKELAINEIKKLIYMRVHNYNMTEKKYVVHSLSTFEKMNTKEKFKKNLLKK